MSILQSNFHEDTYFEIISARQGSLKTAFRLPVSKLPLLKPEEISQGVVLCWSAFSFSLAGWGFFFSVLFFRPSFCLLLPVMYTMGCTLFAVILGGRLLAVKNYNFPTKDSFEREVSLKFRCCICDALSGKVYFKMEI